MTESLEIRPPNSVNVKEQLRKKSMFEFNKYLRENSF